VCPQNGRFQCPASLSFSHGTELRKLQMPDFCWIECTTCQQTDTAIKFSFVIKSIKYFNGMFNFKENTYSPYCLK
jgi:hypothetical protein